MQIHLNIFFWITTEFFYLHTIENEVRWEYPRLRLHPSLGLKWCTSHLTPVWLENIISLWFPGSNDRLFNLCCFICEAVKRFLRIRNCFLFLFGTIITSIQVRFMDFPDIKQCPWCSSFWWLFFRSLFIWMKVKTSSTNHVNFMAHHRRYFIGEYSK